MRALRQGGLVTSTRGPGGGYRLARDPKEVTAWEVIGSLGGSFFPESFCESHPGVLRDCIHSTDCSIRALWRALETGLRDVLDRITLADLQRDESDFATWVETPASSESSSQGSGR
jgi:Rrf2 family protein